MLLPLLPRGRVQDSPSLIAAPFGRAVLHLVALRVRLPIVHPVHNRATFLLPFVGLHYSPNNDERLSAARTWELQHHGMLVLPGIVGHVA